MVDGWWQLGQWLMVGGLVEKVLVPWRSVVGVSGLIKSVGWWSLIGGWWVIIGRLLVGW